jgi:chloramphenicol 3-O-phosphotransferase
MSARIIIISGSPGAGKSTVSRILAENSPHEKAVHIHTDDFYQYIKKGYIAPWQNGSGDQNETMILSAAASAEIWADGGYEVFADGTIGPWFIDPWLELVKKGFDVRYIILRPDEQATVSRVIDREKNQFFPLTDEVVKNLWNSFADMGIYESHKIDTTGLTADESAALIQKMLAEGAFRI